MGTSLNYTKTKLHKVTKLHEGTKLQEDNITPRVNFAQVTFLHKSKKTQKRKITDQGLGVTVILKIKTNK